MATSGEVLAADGGNWRALAADGDTKRPLTTLLLLSFMPFDLVI
jgi:hypothetical protein